MTTTSTCHPSCAAEGLNLLASARQTGRGRMAVRSCRQCTPDTEHVSVRIRRVTTTRGGGVSVAPFDTFNLGDHVGDDPTAVAANRARLAAAIGLGADRLGGVKQGPGGRVQGV